MGLGEYLERAEEDDDVRAVVNRGRGNTFCAGADLNMLDSEFLGTSNQSVKIAQISARHVRPRVQPFQADDRRRRGLAVAGGFELFHLLRLRRRRRQRPHRRLPHPPCAVRRRRPDLPPPRYIGLRKTKELLLTGKLLSGKQCEEWGWPTCPRPAEELEQAVADFVAPMIDKSAFTMRSPSSPANRGLDGDTETLIALESMTCNVAHQSQDAKEACRPSSRSAIPSGSTARPWTSPSTPPRWSSRSGCSRFMDESVYPGRAALPRGR
jgi:enoyl-CoA hydratase/carnithine racemase